MEVFAEEVGRQLGLDAIDDSHDDFVGLLKGCVMARTGDDDISVGEGGYIGCRIDGLLQLGNIDALLGRNGD